MDSRWLALIFAVSLSTQAADSYRLDLAGPVHVTELPATPRVAVPTRVDVYVTGPRTYIDKSVTPASLEKKVPTLSVTNAVEITNLMAVLQVNDNKARITNVTKHQGFTYHLLIRQETNKTVMHFRVFEPNDIRTKWCDVYPRSQPEFAYFNDQIGQWLHAHMDLSSNEPPVLNGDSPKSP